MRKLFVGIVGAGLSIVASTQLATECAVAVTPVDVRNGKGDADPVRSQVTVVDQEGSHEFEVDGNSQSLRSFMSEKGLDMADYRYGDNKALDGDSILGLDMKTSVYKVASEGTSTIVDLPAPTQEKPSAELLVGQKRVQSQGSNGKLLKTVVVTGLEGGKSRTTSETALVLEAPKPKVVLVGTKSLETSVSDDETGTSQGSTDPNVGPNDSSSATSSTPRASAADAARRQRSEEETKRIIEGLRNSGNNGGNSANSSATSNGGSSSSATTVNPAIVSILAAQVGKPYVWGAEGPNAFDCSGLVYFAMNKSGKHIPRLTADQYGARAKAVSLKDAQPGDIFWNAVHIGIYVGNGKVIHAANPRVGVVVEDVRYFTSSGYQLSRLP